MTSKPTSSNPSPSPNAASAAASPTSFSPTFTATFPVVQPAGFPGLPTGWVAETDSFTASDGVTRLFGLTLRRTERRTGRTLVVFHGLGEHAGRYFHFAHYLADVVDAIYLHDHRGNGRSGGLRGHVDEADSTTPLHAFDSLARDGWLVIRRAAEIETKRHGGYELHLFGHSLGGLIVLRTLLQSPAAGPSFPTLASVTVSAPFLGIKAKVPAVKKAAAGILAKVWGSLQLSTELDAAKVSRDPEVVKTYRADRLVHDKMTPAFYRALHAAFADTLANAPALRAPISFQIPMQDEIVDAAISLGLFEQLAARDKRLHTYPGFYHEPFNELGKEQAFADLANWIRAHSQMPEPFTQPLPQP